MVNCIVPLCRKDPSELCKVQICEKGSNKDYADDGTLLGGNPNAVKRNIETVLCCTGSVYFTDSILFLGHLFWVILVILCDQHLNIRRFGQPLP